LSTLTAANRRRFLKAYAKCGAIAEAARLAKVDRGCHYDWMQDPDYRREFEAAHETACDMLESECRRRAVEGVEEPVIYQGELQYKLDKNGKRTNIPLSIRRKSDVLLIFLLKAARPEKYRDNWKGEIKHEGSMTIHSDPYLSKLSDEEFETLSALMHKCGVDEKPAVNGNALSEVA
jgi:hypothetical protein